MVEVQLGFHLRRNPRLIALERAQTPSRSRCLGRSIVPIYLQTTPLTEKLAGGALVPP